jgi:hypothetical protein
LGDRVQRLLPRVVFRERGPAGSVRPGLPDAVADMLDFTDCVVVLVDDTLS